FVIPDGERVHYGEKVAWLPDCFLPTDASRLISPHTPSRAEAGLPSDGFVFCCFNNTFKITPDEFDIWMRLLERVEGSVLWLTALSTASERAMNNLRREAQQRGIAPHRLVFAPKVPSNADHLARLRL